MLNRMSKMQYFMFSNIKYIKNTIDICFLQRKVINLQYF